MAEHIELGYYGGDADRHVLDLYDAGRALYGAARFIYTLENFRVNGVIVEHATTAKVKFELHAPAAGCFTFDIQNVLATIGPDQVGKILQVPFSALLAWITRKLSGDEAHTPIPLDADIEREKTIQTAITSMRDVSVKSIESQNELLKTYAAELVKITDERTRELSIKLRPPLIDMARPTSSDAAFMTLSVGENPPVLYMDERIVEGIKGNRLDDIAELTSARFIQYNVETGWGKVRLPWRISPYRFSVHRVIRDTATPDILSAMDESEAVWVWFYCLRDKGGNISSLVFDRFAKETEMPPP